MEEVPAGKMRLRSFETPPEKKPTYLFYNCLECGMGFPTLHEMEAHEDRTHKLCQLCQADFDSIQELKAHLFDLHNMYYCSKCKGHHRSIEEYNACAKKAMVYSGSPMKNKYKKSKGRKYSAPQSGSLTTGTADWVCCKCQAAFHTAVELQYHLSDHILTEHTDCNSCAKCVARTKASILELKSLFIEHTSRNDSASGNEAAIETTPRTSASPPKSAVSLKKVQVNESTAQSTPDGTAQAAVTPAVQSTSNSAVPIAKPTPTPAAVVQSVPVALKTPTVQSVQTQVPSTPNSIGSTAPSTSKKAASPLEDTCPGNQSSSKPKVQIAYIDRATKEADDVLLDLTPYEKHLVEKSKVMICDATPDCKFSTMCLKKFNLHCRVNHPLVSDDPFKRVFLRSFYIKYRCPICMKAFQTFESYLRHADSAVCEYMNKTCKFCDEVFETNFLMLQHAEHHIREKLDEEEREENARLAEAARLAEDSASDQATAKQSIGNQGITAPPTCNSNVKVQNPNLTLLQPQEQLRKSAPDSETSLPVSKRSKTSTSEPVIQQSQPVQLVNGGNGQQVMPGRPSTTAQQRPPAASLAPTQPQQLPNTTISTSVPQSVGQSAVPSTAQQLNGQSLPRMPWMSQVQMANGKLAPIVYLPTPVYAHLERLTQMTGQQFRVQSPATATTCGTTPVSTIQFTYSKRTPTAQPIALTNERLLQLQRIQQQQAQQQRANLTARSHPVLFQQMPSPFVRNPPPTSSGNLPNS